MECSEIQKEKQKLREFVWSEMKKAGITRKPGPEDTIPNFIGAEKAARRVTRLMFWHTVRVLTCNADAPQQALRHSVLEKGKLLYMAAPELSRQKCFFELHPQKIGRKFDFASTVPGAFKVGAPIDPKDMRKPNCFVVGSVAVNGKGQRVGNGGGFSDILYALAKQAGLIDDSTPVLTTVHPLQIVENDILMTEHDIPVDYIVSPDTIIETKHSLNKPEGIYWDYLDDEKIEAVPVLKKLKG